MSYEPNLLHLMEFWFDQFPVWLASGGGGRANQDSKIGVNWNPSLGYGLPPQLQYYQTG